MGGGDIAIISDLNNIIDSPVVYLALASAQMFFYILVLDFGFNYCADCLNYVIDIVKKSSKAPFKLTLFKTPYVTPGLECFPSVMAVTIATLRIRKTLREYLLMHKGADVVLKSKKLRKRAHRLSNHYFVLALGYLLRSVLTFKLEKHLKKDVLVNTAFGYSDISKLFYSAVYLNFLIDLIKEVEFRRWVKANHIKRKLLI